MNLSAKTKDLLFLSLVVFLLAILKIPDFSLPYFWDEAWSYIPAIEAMAKQGPSLMPNAIDPDLYRGHPLLFYFLTSSWKIIFGDSILALKLFPFTVAVLIIVVYHQLLKHTFNDVCAKISVVFLVSQSVFFAQSSFVLPELLLCLFGLLSMYAFVKKQSVFLVLWLSAALLTKESGLVIWGIIGLFSLIELTQQHKNDWYRFKRLKHLLWLSVPILLFALFFSLQKIKTGWFFYPLHLDYINGSEFTDKLSQYFSYLVNFVGRIGLTVAGTLSFLFLAFRKRFTQHKANYYALVFISFVVVYLIFSAFNFYSPRYALAIFPFTIGIFVYYTHTALKKQPLVLAAVLITCYAFNIHHTIFNRKATDHMLGYRDAISVHQKVVTYCEQQQYYNDTILTHFLMSVNLTNPDVGYLSDSTIFKHVTSSSDINAGIVIVGSIEHNGIHQQLIDTKKGKLVKRFERGRCWAEIYELPNQGFLHSKVW